MLSNRPSSTALCANVCTTCVANKPLPFPDAGPFVLCYIFWRLLLHAMATDLLKWNHLHMAIVLKMKQKTHSSALSYLFQLMVERAEHFPYLWRGVLRPIRIAGQTGINWTNGVNLCTTSSFIWSPLYRQGEKPRHSLTTTIGFA